ncbi:MAG TPA: hypothetical protein VFS04_07835 [Alphaproteobacteria bacterium]|nr:hypothetical protein [Alphaproteobacteria bacterium]
MSYEAWGDGDDDPFENAIEAGWLDPADLSKALIDVMNERDRQHNEEGWTPEHDDQHDDFSLAKAASVYAACASVGAADRAVMDQHGLRGAPAKLQELWPLSWDISWLKPTSRRRDLVKAAALIIAEIERLDRAEAAKP